MTCHTGYHVTLAALLVTVCGVIQWFILAVEGARADNPHCSSVLLIDYLRLHF